MRVCKKCKKYVYDNEKYCSNCGKIIPSRILSCEYCGVSLTKDELKNHECSHCGAKISYDNYDSNVVTYFCIYCGNSIPTTSKYCPQCGRLLRKEEQESASEGKTKVLEKDLVGARVALLVISLILVGIITLPVILYDLYSSDSDVLSNSSTITKIGDAKFDAYSAIDYEKADSEYVEYSVDDLFFMITNNEEVKEGLYVKVTGIVSEVSYDSIELSCIELGLENREFTVTINGYHKMDEDLSDLLQTKCKVGDKVEVKGRINFVYYYAKAVIMGAAGLPEER